MTITLDIPPQLEGPLRDYIARHGEAGHGLLNAAFASALETLLASTPPPLTDEEYEALIDQMDDEWEADGGPTDIVPADKILSREDIYEDHP